MKNVPNNEDFDNGTMLIVCVVLGLGVTICSCFACAVTVAILWWIGVL